jgi:N-acyl-D-amino-acid deacylase
MRFCPQIREESVVRTGSRRWPGSLFVLPFILFCVAAPACAQTTADSLSERIQKVIDRPEFAHANFGIEFISLDSGRVIYALNSSKMFVPASTTKIFTEGALLAKLGADFRFHTSVYHTGTIDSRGRLKGDLVLVASGDPDLSNRIRPDGTLAFRDDDHSYGGPAVDGDPLAVIKALARDVAAKGIRKIEGRVLVDTTLLPDSTREPGTGVVVSSIVINDNLIDLVAKPGVRAGDSVILASSPQTSYVKFINHMTTTAAGTAPSFSDPEITTNSDGTVTALLTGSMPVGMPAITAPFPVPSPTNFAQTVLRESLVAAGIQVQPPKRTTTPDFDLLKRDYTPENRVAEHISPPLAEEIKVTLKVSQNLHAALSPYLLGALVAKNMTDSFRAGFEVERSFLQEAHLDLSGASQGDGAGGDAADHFSPDFACRYLAYWTTRPDYKVFFNALPVLGKDGTLSDIQTKSIAAGHVFAKTGTLRARDWLNGKGWLRGKALVGYVHTSSGQKLAFASYVNNVSLPRDPDAADRIAGQALGEIAAAAYDAPLEAAYDIIIRNGHIIDGTGNPWYAADVGIEGDRVAAIGDLRDCHAAREIDASGRIVAPGFVDMLGQSEINLLLDNRSLSKLSQGITTEITGESMTVAPQTEKTLAAMKPFLEAFKFTVDWTTLDGYFRRLERQGMPINLGTYVGAGQLRAAVIGYDDRPPTPAELEEMKTLAAESMEQGALGLSSALVYPPAAYAKTSELIALAQVASKYGGLYATHIRSEGVSEISALDEAIRIGEEAHLPVEIFHLKVMGKSRWGDMKKVVLKIQAARDAGLDIAADMYPYTAGSTSLAAALPPWVADGGRQKMLERLKDPVSRARIKQELAEDHPDWENFYLDAGGAPGILIASTRAPALKQFEGKTLEEIAKAWRKPPIDALMDFVLADPGRTQTIYFLGSEGDLKLGLEQPWTSIGLDYGEMSLDGPIHEAHGHPRAFGSMPRFLGLYVREERLLTLEEAIRKLTSLPAQREHLQDRGLLQRGYFADIVVLNPATIIDRATYAAPDKISEGVDFTIVNGQIEYDKGKLTGATAGRILRGRGWDPEKVTGPAKSRIEAP